VNFLTKTFIALLCSSVLFIGETRAQSSFAQVNVAGSFNGWNTDTTNLVLVAPYTWSGDLTITNLSFEFKFTTPGWTSNWGENDQPHETMPLAAYVEASAGNIVLTNTSAGSVIRFTFHEQTQIYSVFVINNTGTNLLYNSGFETQGSFPEEAKYWEFFNPNAHGARAGATERGDWASSVSGDFFGAILNSSFHPDNFGSWWQETPAEPGLTYSASGWFVKEGPPYEWQATTEELRLEFYDFSGQLLSGSATRNLSDVGATWVQRSISAEAPVNTAFARWTVFTAGNGTDGNFRIDDASLSATGSKRSEDFNAWGAASSDGFHTLGGWTVNTGKTVSFVVDGLSTTVLARAGFAADLANPDNNTNGAGYIQSPRLGEGVGLLTFYYRHGFYTTDSDDEPDEPVRLRVDVSTSGEFWTPVATIEDIYSQSYVRFALDINEPAHRYVRIVHAGGSTERVFIDDIFVDIPSSSPRFMDFNAWPAAGTNLGCHPSQDWTICTGLVSTAQAHSGLSAQIFGSQNSTNYLRSPQFTGGYGPITFDYRRGTNGGSTVGFRLEMSSNGTDWTLLDSVSGIGSPSWQTYSGVFFEDSAHYIRIRNITETNAPGGGQILLSEPFDDGENAPPGWTFNNMDQYTTEASSGENPPSAGFKSSGAYFITPSLSKPTNVTFMIKGQSIDPSSSLKMEGLINGNWVTLQTFSSISNSKTTQSASISTNVTALRFEYTKVAGNLAFDDLVVRGLAAVGSGPQILMLDNVHVQEPVENREQDFDSWPRKGSYTSGATEHQYWTIKEDAIVDQNNAYEGQVARLRRQTSNNPHVQSPFLGGGIGAIEFVYRRWPGDGSGTIAVQVSSNGSSWTTLANVTDASDSVYKQFSLFVNDASKHYVRLAYTAGPNDSRVLIDEIRVPAPAPAADLLLSAWHTPDRPFTNDTVQLSAQTIPLNGARDVAVTSYYRVGSSGGFTPLPMTLQGGGIYVSATSIPAQPAGTVVEYYTVAHFAGPDANSPVYFPAGGSSNPAFYGIPRNAPGAVWINEIDHNGYYFDFDEFEETDVEFIELAGAEGVDMSGWSIEIRDGSSTNMTLVAAYDIPTNTLIPNDVNGFGFFVLGRPGIPSPPRDMVMTNLLSWYVPGAIRLINEMGQIEQALAYGGGAPGHPYIGASDSDFILDPPTNSVALTGTGSSYEDFTWGESSPTTPGDVNNGQNFGDPAEMVAIPSPVNFAYIKDSVSPPPQMMVISNAGGTNLTFSITPTPSWLSVTPAGATNVAPGGTSEHWVSVNTTGQVGVLNGNLALAGSASPLDVPVIVTEVLLDDALLYYDFDEGGGAVSLNEGSVGGTGNVTLVDTAWSLNAAGASATVGDYALALTNHEARAVTAGAITSLNNRAEITITGWIYPNGTGTGGVHTIVNNRENNHGFTVQMATNNQDLAFISSAGSEPSAVVSTNGLFPTNAWSFFAVSYDSSNASNDAVRFYRGTKNDPVTLYSSHAKGGLEPTGVSTGQFTVGAFLSTNVTFVPESLPVTNGLVVHLDPRTLTNVPHGNAIENWVNLAYNNDFSPVAGYTDAIFHTNVVFGGPAVLLSNSFLRTALPEAITGDELTAFMAIDANARNGAYAGALSISKSAGSTDNNNADGAGLFIENNTANRFTTWRNKNARSTSGTNTLATSPGVWRVYSTKFSGSNNRMFVNGIGQNTVSYFGNFNASSVSLGRRSASDLFVQGYYGHVLIYDRELDDLERESVEEFLQRLYLTGQPFLIAGERIWQDAFLGQVDEIRVFGNKLSLMEIEAVRQESASRTSASLVAPTISVHPQSQTNNLSAFVSFNVVADGTPNPDYQWRLNGEPLQGRTLQNLDISSVQVSDAGQYDVVAFNVAGAVTSQVATLTVHYAPEFTEHPADQMVVIGESLALNATVAGEPTPSLQWFFNNQTIPGATGTSYAIPSVAYTNAGPYYVVAANALGVVTSSVATVTVAREWWNPGSFPNPPVLWLDAADTNTFVFDGGDLAEWLDKSGHNRHAVQSNAGRRPEVTTNGLNGLPLVTYAGSGQALTGVYNNVTFNQQSTFVLLNYESGSETYTRFFSQALDGQTGDATGSGHYIPLRRDGSGSSIGAFALGNPRAMISHPTGDWGLFSAMHSGSQIRNYVNSGVPGTYDHDLNGVFRGYGVGGSVASSVSQSLQGDIAEVIVLDVFQNDDDRQRTEGYLAHKWGVTHLLPTNHPYKSELPAVLTPEILLQPDGTNVLAGEEASFSVDVTGPLPISYQWTKDGVTIGGATGTTYAIASASSGDAADYRVRVINPHGVTTSQVAVLDVLVSLDIDEHPQNMTVWEGETANFEVVASGTPPLLYQWQKNTAPIGGATSTLYTITSVLTNDAGDYRVVVSNAYGSITSAVASLTVQVFEWGGGDAEIPIAAPTSGNGMVLRWPSLSGRLYDVYWTSNLLGGTEGFVPLATNLPATPTVNVYTDTVSGVQNRGFYYIQSKPEP